MKSQDIVLNYWGYIEAGRWEEEVGEKKGGKREGGRKEKGGRKGRREWLKVSPQV